MIDLNNDRTLNIALGDNRKSINWKNKTMPWMEFLKKISNSEDTGETYQHYMSASKSEQDNIKDIGGFVGGKLKGKKRKVSEVVSRSMLTLDADFAKDDLWDNFTMLNDYAAAIYSTHKHSNEAPRYRLIIPLARDVTPQEYEAIGRKIAGDIGIDYFDDTTYQVNRLMYWPSHATDGEVFFDKQDGKFLNPDEILAQYDDWQDRSQWPRSSREKKDAKTFGARAKKQGDPLEKDGLIGAFCRAYYPIDEAIEEFLSDVYIKCDMPNRYTYAEGSSSAGLVIYDDVFAYSNHDTDPCSKKLCNAFDLVRIHKFGELDKEMPEGTAVTTLPSYNAMLEFAQNDKQTKLERLKQTQEDFDEKYKDASPEWLNKLETNKKNEVLSTINNIEIILRNDPEICHSIALDLFAHKTVILDDLPWRKKERSKVWLDSDDSGLESWLERIYRIKGKAKIQAALTNIFEEKGFHPVQEYLNDLVWDGVCRLDSMFIDYLGAEDNIYVRQATRKQFVAAVARVYEPGIKKDEMLVLVGKQGLGKSTLLDELGLEWFSDSIEDFKGKEVAENLQGRWIIEIAELEAMKRNEVETVKKFLSKRVDIFRMPYGKRSYEYDRQCVFFGTTNKREFLKDDTGDRRFWPIDTQVNEPTKNVFNGLDKNEVAQIWAEAKYRYEQGEKLYLEGEAKKIVEEMQAEHKIDDPRIGQIQAFLDMKLPTDWPNMSLQARRDFIHNNQFELEEYIIRDRVCAAEICCELFKNDLSSRSRYETSDINTILSHMEGWEKANTNMRFGKLYGQQRGFKRKSV